MNPTPTAPAPQTKRVQVPLKQLVEAWRWSATVNQYPDQSIDRPPDAQLIASALLVAVDRLTQIARADRSALILDELRKIRALLTPAPPATTDPDAERQRRELASRLRAGEAYRRAGGTMPLDDRPPVTPDTPLTELGFGGRARGVLEWRLNCKTVGDLCARTRLDVETAWGCGVATFQDIMRVLARHGLTLAAETPHATTQQETP